MTEEQAERLIAAINRLTVASALLIVMLLLTAGLYVAR